MEYVTNKQIYEIITNKKYEKILQIKINNRAAHLTLINHSVGVS